MADFTSFLQSFKPSYSLLDVDPNIELLNQFAVLNQSLVENTNLNSQCFMGFSNENFFSTQQATADHQFPAGQLENFPAIFHHDEKNVMVIPEPVVSGGNDFHCLDSRKRKLAMDVSESSSGNSSPPVSESGIERKHSSGKGKKMKVNGKEDGLPKEVVHVRARRGQATDSHSLAERVRRGKINERLRRLQDIVPGCYKTMGMAVMLDEIINYVQSLHNQVEFLSMKLTEASRFHNFNSETGAIELLQRTKAYEAQKMQRLERESGSTPTQIGPIDLTFGTYPSLPYNT